MRNKLPEAAVLRCKCVRTNGMAGIRCERMNGWWYATWAFKMRETAKGNEKSRVTGGGDLGEEYPGCPYCGADSFFSCGNCGQVNCWNTADTYTKCACCGNESAVAAGNFQAEGEGY